MTMRIEFDAISEATPGQKWQTMFAQNWPGWREWQRRKTHAAEPSLAECERALRRYMPELLPLWEKMVELTGEDEAAARFLSFWCPPRYLLQCSQAILIDKRGPLLIRNYDLDPALSEATILRSAWKGRLVMATVEGIAGVADGINESGLAASLTFGGRTNAGRGFGIPLIMRYLLEVCNDAQDGIEALRSVPCHMSYNVSLVDSSGKFATVFLSPDRPAIVTAEPVSTNHQLGIEWPAEARRSRTIERKDVLTKLLAETEQSGDRILAAFLAPPLFSTNYAEGFGTVYTALYRPSERSMSLHWHGQPEWHKTIKAFSEDQRTIVYPIDAGSTADMPEERMTAQRKPRGNVDFGRWQSYLPTRFAQALSSNIRDPGSANWATLQHYWADRDRPKPRSFDRVVGG
jgi:predicted choloylglycine hydrolase